MRTIERLSTPSKIQDYLNSIPFNFEKEEETCRSPKEVILTRTAHCFEGALFAAATLWLQGEPPLLFDLRTTPNDQEHVVALYRREGLWGAISKTNHSVLRFREPIYATLGELAKSYFHEYFLKDGTKTLREYSKNPFDLRKFGTAWVASSENLWNIDRALDRAPHSPIAPKKILRSLRKAEKIERISGELIEWTKGGKKRL
jgi:hypothetical protein